MSGLAGALVVVTGLLAGLVLATHQPAPIVRPGTAPVTAAVGR